MEFKPERIADFLRYPLRKTTSEPLKESTLGEKAAGILLVLTFTPVPESDKRVA
jgi:hypothetical protein